GWGWQGRFSGMMENPNTLAIFLIFSVYLSLFYLNDTAKKPRLLLFIHFINILLSFYTLFLTQSRKGVVFALMLVASFFLFKFTLKKAILFISLIATFILTLLLVPALQD